MSYVTLQTEISTGIPDVVETGLDKDDEDDEGHKVHGRAPRKKLLTMGPPFFVQNSATTPRLPLNDCLLLAP